MYRLLNLRPIYINKFHNPSLYLKCDRNRESKVSFSTIENKQTISCKNCLRYQSTNNNLAPINKVKRRKSPKKYYDLLVVTDKKIKQQKTSIQKLKWSDLQLLATTNLRLSELYKLKDLSQKNEFIEEHTYNNLTIIEDLPQKQANLVEQQDKEINCDLPENPTRIEPEFLIEDDDTHGHERINHAFQPEIIEETIEEDPQDVQIQQQQQQERNQQKQQQIKTEIANKTLGAYLEICSILKQPQRGLNALLFHNNRVERGYKGFYPIKKIEIYNALLKGFAQKGNFQKLEEILQITKKEGVQFNLQTYVHIFECFARLSEQVKDNHLKSLRQYCKEAKQNQITFDKIMNYGRFSKEQFQLVLQTIHRIDKEYVPEFFKPNLQYNNELINVLNCDEQNRGVRIDDTPIDPTKSLFSLDEMKARIEQQLKLEKDGYVTVKSIENFKTIANNDEVQKYRDLLQDHYRMWEETATVAFKRDLLTLQSCKRPLNDDLYLRCIPVDDFIKILIEEAKKIAEGSETYSPTIQHLYRDLGMKVYQKFQILRKEQLGMIDKALQIHQNYCRQYLQQHTVLDYLPKQEENNLLNSRQLWQWFEYNSRGNGASLLMEHNEWPSSVLQIIGKFLYNIIMNDLKIDLNSLRLNNKQTKKNLVPAFYTIFRQQGRLIKEEVKPHPTLSKLYRSSVPEVLKFPTNEIPMLCPPLPWISINNGGYLISPCDVVRLPQQATTQRKRLIDTKKSNLYPSFDALNQLSSVPWKVNQDILDVILHVFNNGGSIKLDVPQSPDMLEPPPIIQHYMDKTEKFKLFKKRLQYRRKRAEMYSLWCDCLYRLSLANHFRNDIFWLPHNMDFRGRVYPIPPHLNHLGSDLARSILIFAESRPLGPNGLDWLKIHLINLTGLKKHESIQARLNYANEIIDLIIDSADHPLNGKMWWCESDEPWQTLACCMEITKAVRSGNIEEYRSCYPIHQDGSCNGLQHYAALGRDSAGAYSVNLCQSTIPQDVYSAVVQLVEEQRCKDAENGVEIAKILNGFIKRKVIKQTIMTTVYGVTRYGARLQIAKQLKDLDNFPKDSIWQASTYLTQRTFDSLRTMFKSTREIQDWFTDCARLISTVSGQHVEWVTPMGLPVVQPYFRYKPLGQNLVYKPFHMDHYEKPNVMKQKNAFPPNFIHSLDSSHMMLTSLFCERAGITFVSVHDCYWTHPSTVHIMNRICRQQFVALHSQPILENLSMFLSEKYSYNHDEFTDDGSVTDLTKKKLNRILRQLPKTGDFDINQVLNSIYFFS